MSELTEKQQAFVREYVANRGTDGAAAARRAGYAGGKRDAWRNLQNPKIKKRIQEEMKRAEADAAVNPEMVRARLWAEANDYLDGNANTRVGALKVLAQHLGMLTEKVEMNADVNVSGRLAGLSLAELKAIAHGRR
jgi:hypothetical protein